VDKTGKVFFEYLSNDVNPKNACSLFKNRLVSA